MWVVFLYYLFKHFLWTQGNSTALSELMIQGILGQYQGWHHRKNTCMCKCMYPCPQRSIWTAKTKHTESNYTKGLIHSIVLNTSNYKHTCNPFLPASRFPQNQSDRAEKESHNDVITFSGSQDMYWKENMGGGGRRTVAKEQSWFGALESRLLEQGSVDYPRTWRNGTFSIGSAPVCSCLTTEQ